MTNDTSSSPNQSIPVEPNTWIAAAATGDGVLCVYAHGDNTVSIWEIHREQGPSIEIPVDAIPAVIRMFQDALRAYGREVS